MFGKLPRFFKMNVMFVLALLLLGLMGVLAVNGQEATVQANVDGIDEIVVIGTDGYVYAYNFMGEEIFKSPEAGWKLVTTGDMNNDGDAEIIAANDDKVKVFDPQVVGTEFKFETTYSGDGDFSNIGVGDFWNDGNLDIALIRSLGKDSNDNGRSRIIIYSPPTTSTKIDVKYDLTDWDDFAIGDYDGDKDDDFAFIYWNDDYPSGYRSWLELRKGKNPDEFLAGDDDATDYSNLYRSDIVSGNFKTDNGDKVEWATSRNYANDDEKATSVQHWSDGKIKVYWAISDPFTSIAAGDFRNDGRDQLVMVRDNRVQFATQGWVWGKATNIGTGWKNSATGNLDEEDTYGEAVILRSNLMRIYLRAQGDDTSLDCDQPEECRDISGSFKGPLATGDLGLTFDPIEPFSVSTDSITVVAKQDEDGKSAVFYIYGETADQEPRTWTTHVLAYTGYRLLEEAVAQDPILELSIAANGPSVAARALGIDETESVDWITLKTDENIQGTSYVTGTTPSTVTVQFADTKPGSPIYDEGVYRTRLLVTSEQSEEVFFINVLMMVGGKQIYIPLVLK